MSNFAFHSNPLTNIVNNATASVLGISKQNDQAATNVFSQAQNMITNAQSAASSTVRGAAMQAGAAAVYPPGSEHQFYVAHGNVLGFGGSQMIHEAEVYDPMKPFASQVNQFDALQRYDLSQHFSEGQKYIGNLDSGSGHTVGSLLHHASDRLSQYEEYNQAINQVNQGINQGIGYANNALGYANTVVGKADNLYSAGSTLASSVSSNFKHDPISSGGVPSGSDAFMAGVELVGIGLGGKAAYSARSAQLAQEASDVLMEAGELGEAVGLEGAETVAAEAVGAAFLPELAMGAVAVGAAYEVGKATLTVADYFTGGQASTYVKNEAQSLENTIKGWF